jgi:hypothetical protein
MRLSHLTIETGHCAVTPRSDIADEIIMRLQPIIDEQGGLIKEAGIYIDIIRPLMASGRPRDGAAAFTLQLGHGGPALASNVVCWQSDMADEAWIMCGNPNRAPLTDQQIVKPNAPWLATMLLPAVVDAPHDAVRLLADLERCLAWTLIETSI